MGNVIREVFNEVWKRRKGTEPPALDADRLLLDIDLDSLGFAIVATQLDEKLGFDPFSIAQDAFIPRASEKLGSLHSHLDLRAERSIL